VEGKKMEEKVTKEGMYFLHYAAHFTYIVELVTMIRENILRMTAGRVSF
jgi:hypothetical protein